MESAPNRIRSYSPPIYLLVQLRLSKPYFQAFQRFTHNFQPISLTKILNIDSERTQNSEYIAVF